MEPGTTMFGRLFYFHGCAGGTLVGPHPIYPYIMGHENGIHRLGLIQITAMIRIIDKKELAVGITLT